MLAFVLLNPSAELPSASVTRATDLLVRLGVSPLLATGERVEFLMNVAIMVPVGLLGTVAWPRLGWRDWAAYGFVASSAVELVQGVLLAGRSATFADVVANTAGAALGAFVLVVWRWVREA